MISTPLPLSSKHMQTYIYMTQAQLYIVVKLTYVRVRTQTHYILFKAITDLSPIINSLTKFPIFLQL